MKSHWIRALCVAAVAAVVVSSDIAFAQSAPPPTPTNFQVTFVYANHKYRFTASWTAPGATQYHLIGHSYNGPNNTVSWTVPENWEDLSIEYYVQACNAAGCSQLAGPVYATQYF